MENNSLETPVTNRGVTHTIDNSKVFDFKWEINKLGQYILFDWFQFTIPIKKGDDFKFFEVATLFNPKVDKTYSFAIGEVNRFKIMVYQLFLSLFHIDTKDLFFEEKGINGYSHCISYDNIRMYFNPSQPLMGINVLMSGQGCRDFDILGLDYKELVKKVNDLGGKYNRVDIAIDDFSNKYFTLRKLKDYINSGLVISKFRTYFHMRKGIIENNVILGDTLQFGSRASLVQITFYDKLQERKNNNYIVRDDIKYWVRTELRFRNEKVSELFEYYLNSTSLNQFVKGVLGEYMRFLKKNESDDNKWRWETAQWWTDYLENMDKIRFVPATLETSISRKKNWLLDSTSKSAIMCLIADSPNLSVDDRTTDYLYQYFKLGFEKIKDKDLQSINTYRISKGDLPIEREQMEDFVRDIKDQIIAMEEITLDELNARNDKLNTTSDNLYYVNLYILKSLFYSIYIMLYLLNKLI